MAQQQTLMDAYRDLFRSLWDRMAVMLGRLGAYSLVERALFETQKDKPLAKDLILEDQGLDFSDLESKAADIEMQELRDTMNELVVSVVGILAEQVGRTIAERIAKGVVTPGESRE